MKKFATFCKEARDMFVSLSHEVFMVGVRVTLEWKYWKLNKSLLRLERYHQELLTVRDTLYLLHLQRPMSVMISAELARCEACLDVLQNVIRESKRMIEEHHVMLALSRS